jgi:hypothetical protein
LESKILGRRIKRLARIKRKTMKTALFILAVCSLCWGCLGPSKRHGKYIDGRLYAVSDIGAIVVEGIYTLEYVRQGSEREQQFLETVNSLEYVETEHPGLMRLADGQLFPEFLGHPHFPDRDQMKEIERVYKGGDLLAYCKGPDSGWALLRRGGVVFIWVTEHSF